MTEPASYETVLVMYRQLFNAAKAVADANTRDALAELDNLREVMEYHKAQHPGIAF